MRHLIKRIIEIADNNNPASVMHDDPRKALEQILTLALGCADADRQAETLDDNALASAVHDLQDPDTVLAFKNGYFTLTPDELRRVIAGLSASCWTATADQNPPVGQRVFWLDKGCNMVGYDTYMGEPYRFNASHWMRIPKA